MQAKNSQEIKADDDDKVNLVDIEDSLDHESENSLSNLLIGDEDIGDDTSMISKVNIFNNARDVDGMAPDKLSKASDAWRLIAFAIENGSGAT